MGSMSESRRHHRTETQPTGRDSSVKLEQVIALIACITLAASASFCVAMRP